MPITAGSIFVVRRINTGDYSHKEAKAEVHYTVEPNEDPVEAADTASMHALTQVAKVLATQVTLAATPEIKLGAPESVKSEQVEQAAKRHRRTKAEMEAARAAETPPVDPTVAASTPSVATEGVQADDVSSSMLASSDEISDKELNNACNETMNRIKNKVLIQGVIQRYTDGVVSTIPQAERAKFLTELKAL